ncbi:MAG TPA: class I SAM-dependent methyltransferase [Chloroflexota bacterium]|jgi:ubiquinone/menaquinone biosynthesis C-methylase UbiE|nr:class I SAM-dependent methyltransferase [Chloroflexota bacterium]
MVQTTADARPTKGHPWFAAFYDLLSRGEEERIVAPLRRWVVGEATGRVLEIGAGTGLSFPYYRRDVQLVATEPGPYMLRRARRRAAALGLPVEFHAAPAEALPLPDASFDAVVCTLVLCTVADPVRALGEVRRVLKPEGTFRFIEHVRGHGWLGRAHDLVTPVWRRIGAGCHPNRRTGETIEAAGFRTVRLEEGRLPPGLPLIAGTAH